MPGVSKGSALVRAATGQVQRQTWTLAGPIVARDLDEASGSGMASSSAPLGQRGSKLSCDRNTIALHMSLAVRIRSVSGDTRSKTDLHKPAEFEVKLLRMNIRKAGNTEKHHLVEQRGSGFRGSHTK